MSDERGIVYLLSNPAMPNLIKIGFTSQNDIKMRMANLYSSGDPLPWK